MISVINRFIHIIAILFLMATQLAAQLSPGELARAHQNLEGIKNCTQCHDLGNKVTNEKCLACHKEIKSLISQNKGFHVSWEAKNKDCAKCHSDHHGRNFDMVRFDEKNFDHNKAGYKLTGAHGRIDCRDCHKPDLIADSELRKRKDTYLGLRTNCNACHEDVHQKTLGNDCNKCHETEKFAPASKFNHDKANFKLVGQHKTVDCKECHEKEWRNGKEFQKFTNIPFKNCNDCHNDPHDNNLGTNCRQCHSEVSFTNSSALSSFNHNQTNFPLKGRHSKVSCRECHDMNTSPLLVFQDKLGIKTNACATCHKDVHEGRFGNNCAECHNEDGFRKVGNLDKFDHNRTSFELKGKHATVDCKKCHTTKSMTDPLPHNACALCHDDYHNGQFAGLVSTPDCATCHTENDFAETTYTLEKHAKSKFPLEGGHIATPCFACHLKEDKWQFRKIGERCKDCHDDVHNGQIAEKWYPDKKCENCHMTESWQDNQFDHSKTDFALKGAHTKQHCSACHVPQEGYKYGVFAGLHNKCNDCHKEEHHRQFEVEGVTDCARCHSNENWEIARFDHDKTEFKLEGKHASVACEDCHKEITVAQESFVQYKFENLACATCHQ